MKLAENRVYQVDHSRKGRFKMLIKTAGETWISGTIVEGKARAMLQYNEVEKGEDITIRKSHASFTPTGIEAVESV